MLSQDLPLTSITFLCCQGNYCELPLPFCASCGHSVNLHQLSVRLVDLPSTSVNFPCSAGPSGNFPSVTGPSVQFCLLSVWPQDLLSAFRSTAGLFVNLPCDRGTFSQLLFDHGNFRQLPLPFCAAGGPSVSLHHLSMLPGDFPSSYSAAAGHTVNFCQLSVGCMTFLQLSLRLQDHPSIFHVVMGLSINFH